MWIDRGFKAWCGVEAAVEERDHFKYPNAVRLTAVLRTENVQAADVCTAYLHLCQVI